jgi:hypothetical protein
MAESIRKIERALAESPDDEQIFIRYLQALKRVGREDEIRGVVEGWMGRGHIITNELAFELLSLAGIKPATFIKQISNLPVLDIKSWKGVRGLSFERLIKSKARAYYTLAKQGQKLRELIGSTRFTENVFAIVIYEGMILARGHRALKYESTHHTNASKYFIPVGYTFGPTYFLCPDCVTQKEADEGAITSFGSIHPYQRHCDICGFHCVEGNRGWPELKD